MPQNLATVEKFYTEEEYLAFERGARNKHELVDGEIVAMAGASRRHNLITINIASGLHIRLKGKGCETYSSEMRVRMKKGCYGYPDVVAVCGEPQFADGEFDVLLNPVVVVEVLSKSTRFRDKTEKLETYQKIESIREVLLVDQDSLRIEHYIKQTPMQWLVKIYETIEETIALELIDGAVSVGEIYDRIEFEKRYET